MNFSRYPRYEKINYICYITALWSFIEVLPLYQIKNKESGQNGKPE